jgi:hypothetical protein
LDCVPGSLSFAGKDVYACESAVKDFQTIIQIIGGPKERQRANDLLRNLKIVPDCLSERSKKLKTTYQVKERAKVQ